MTGCFFGSRQGARFLLNAHPNMLEDLRIGTVGSRTAEYLKSLGKRVDFVPERFSSRSWPAEFIVRETDARGILYPTSDRSAFQGARAFEDRGIDFFPLTVYRTVCRNLPLPVEFDAVIFASPSCFECFVDAYGLDSLRDRCVTAIGEVTEARVRSHGLACTTPDRFTLMDALVVTQSILNSR